jgi:hypothetical protein
MRNPNIPTGTCVIEVNSAHTIAIWSRDGEDLNVLTRMIPFPAVEFFYTSAITGGYYTYVQLRTQYQSETVDFVPSISTVEIGKELEGKIASAARYSSNCMKFAPWCTHETCHKLFGD